MLCTSFVSPTLLQHVAGCVQQSWLQLGSVLQAAVARDQAGDTQADSDDGE